MGRGGRLPRHRLVWQHLLLARGALIGALIRAVIGALARESACNKGFTQSLTRRHEVSIASLQHIGRILLEEAETFRQFEVGILGCRTVLRLDADEEPAAAPLVDAAAAVLEDGGVGADRTNGGDWY